MKKLISLLTLTLIIQFGFAQERVNPVIESTGGIFPIDKADKTPDPDIQYKIVLDLRDGSSSADQINPALNNIARMINLHVEGGVDPSNIHIVGVLHGSATPVSQDDNKYNERYNVVNPNNELIQELTEKGVELYVCGQSLEARRFGFDNVNDNIKVSISALTILTEYTSKGYTLLVF